jgi:hypothetical protein
MSEALRPLNMGETLDRAAELYRRHFLRFAAVAAVPSVVVVAAMNVMGAIFRSYAKGAVWNGLLLVNYLALLPVIILASAFAHAALTKSAALAHMGDDLHVHMILKRTFFRIGRYLWLSILQCFYASWLPVLVSFIGIILLGLLAESVRGDRTASNIVGFLVILFLLLMMGFLALCAARYALAVAVCVVEEKTARNSIKRAVALCKDSRIRIAMPFMLWSVLAVVVLVAHLAVFGILVAIEKAITHHPHPIGATLLFNQTLRILLSLVTQTLLFPILSICLAVFYYDQRVRLEGYDIERMMEQAGLNHPVSLPSVADSALYPPAIDLATEPVTVKE